MDEREMVFAEFKQANREIMTLFDNIRNILTKKENRNYNQETTDGFYTVLKNHKYKLRNSISKTPSDYSDSEIQEIKLMIEELEPRLQSLASVASDAVLRTGGKRSKRTKSRRKRTKSRRKHNKSRRHYK